MDVLRFSAGSPGESLGRFMFDLTERGLFGVCVKENQPEWFQEIRPGKEYHIKRSGDIWTFVPLGSWSSTTYMDAPGAVDPPIRQLPGDFLYPSVEACEE